MVTFTPLCSPLFVPATRPERFGKAAASGADAIIVDLEDAVPTDEKDRARAALTGGALDGLAVPVILRITGRATRWHAPDLSAAGSLPLAGVMLPKTENREDLAHMAQHLGPEMPVFALVETATGILALNEITKAPNLAQIAFGSVDFALDISAAHERESLAFARGQIVVCARAHGLAAPLDGITVSTTDPDLLAADAMHAAKLGFGGKLAIHPAQIAGIKSAFSPSAEEVAWARRILAANEVAGGEASQLDGAMIDAPVCERARRILARLV